MAIRTRPTEIDAVLTLDGPALLALTARHALRLAPYLPSTSANEMATAAEGALMAGITAGTAAFSDLRSRTGGSDLVRAATTSMAMLSAGLGSDPEERPMESALREQDPDGGLAAAAAACAAVWAAVSMDREAQEGKAQKRKAQKRRSAEDEDLARLAPPEELRELARYFLEATLDGDWPEPGASVDALRHDLDAVLGGSPLDGIGLWAPNSGPPSAVEGVMEAFGAWWSDAVHTADLPDFSWYADLVAGPADWGPATEAALRWIKEADPSAPLPLTAMGAGPVPGAGEPESDEVVVLDRDGARLRVALEREPWTAGYRALVLPSDAAGNLGGGFATGFMEFAGPGAAARIEKAMKGSDPPTPEQPVVVELEANPDGPPVPRHAVVATAQRKRFSAEAAAVASVAAVREAAGEGGRVALPLLGTGRGGLDHGTVLDAVVGALRSAWPIGDIEEVTIPVIRPALVARARELAVDPAAQAGGSPDGSQTGDGGSPPIVLVPGLPIVASDLATPTDSLNVRGQAEMFAKLLTARDVPMPLSIGLFGKWGVGKSYFMRLMRDEAQTLAAAQDPADDESTYLRRIAQIEFNAWSYVDANLWASLAVRLYEGLVDASRPEQAELETQDEVEQRRLSLRQTVASNEEAKVRAREKQRVAKAEREAAARQLEQLKAERAKKEREYGKVLWKRLTREVDLAGQVEDAKKEARRLGLDASVETVEDAIALYGQLKSLEGRWRTLGLALGHRFSTGWGQALAFAFVVVVIVGAVVAGALVQSLLPGLNALWEDALAMAAQGVALVAPAVVWAGRQMGRLSDATTKLESVKTRIDRLEPPQDEDSEEARLRREVEELESDLQVEEERIDEADRLIREAQAELQRIDNGGLVHDFLRGRGEDDAYTSRLGLVSVIRQDFDQLKTLLAKWNETHDPGRPPIERIILYIDDLDRCHPDQVVKVLQAVHLLLAFDLFAVVVAVDPRWLERSLYRAYLSDADAAKAAEDAVKPRADRGVSREDEFSPQNYLEKIFQIPFSLEGLQPDGYRSLINDLVETRLERDERKARKEEAGEGAEDGAGAARGQGSGEGGRVPPGAGGSGATVAREQAPDDTLDPDEARRIAVDAVAGEPAGSSSATGASRDGANAGSGNMEGTGKAVGPRDASPATSRPDEDSESREEAPDPVLEEWEERFLQALHGFIDTPRLAKRLVNIYRLLRVQAGSIYEDYAEFIDPVNGTYRHALVVLAINIGHPEVAGRLLREVRQAKPTAGLEELLRDLAAEARDGDPRGAAIAPGPREQNSLVRIQDHLAAARAHLASKEARREGGPDLSVPDDVKRLQDWAAEVGRYSFHWNLG